MPFWPKGLSGFGHAGKSCDYLREILQNHPHILQKLPPVIFFAGTNGKGSTLSFVQSILQESSYKIHTYTSPHLVHFNERIILQGKMIDDNFASQALEEARHIFANRPCTFFEGMTVAAFLAFSRIPADFLLIEVGMGGRFDATNIVSNIILSVITSISFDHMEFLGDTIEQIAWEKAGIIAHNQPCIVAKQKFSKSLQVIRNEAKLKNATLQIADIDWQIAKKDAQTMIFQNQNEKYELSLPNLPGDHQIDNAGTAIAAILELKKTKNLSISWQHIQSGLKKTYWPARLEKIEGGFLNRMLKNNFELFVDGAHNPGAAEILAQWIKNQNEKDFFVIVGMTKAKIKSDKLDTKIIDFTKPFLQCQNIKTLTGTCVASEYNAYTSGEIYNDLQKLYFTHISQFSNLEEALLHITKKYSQGTILICGSLYLYSDVIKIKQGQVS